jgi:aspartyl-tRNA(Asn)/glutamyl-tRNA(Gln) amidotransferase subunit C
MKITVEDVRHVAALARLDLSAAEEEKLVAELGAILGYVEALARLDTEGVPPTAHVFDVGPAFRDDEVRNVRVDALLENAPTAGRLLSRSRSSSDATVGILT